MQPRVELKIVIDRGAPGSLSTKIVHELRTMINQNALKPRDLLPPSRVLAKELGVSRGVIVEAYEQLIAEGYLEATQGRGTAVSAALEELHTFPLNRVETKKEPTTFLRDERRPEEQLRDLTQKPAWKAVWRKAALSAELEEELPAAGSADLLEEIAEHLRVMRGTLRSPENLLVTAGAREGLSLLLTALGTTAGKKLIIGVEERGAKTLAEVARQHGAEVILLPVDSNGLSVAQLPNALLDAVIVTPSFQFPEGEALKLSRRRELILWARRNGALIIEDDFDTELRFIKSPLPTLAALDSGDNGVVVTLGSFSATLSISMAAGFLILPKRIQTVVQSARIKLGSPVAPILQIALTELLRSGELRRHVARLRRKRLNTGTT